MANNVLNRYLFEDLSVRGELVQLDEAYQRVISSKEYPAAIEKLLGELLVSTTLLTATLKFEGSITIQLQGDGPVSLAVINGDHKQRVRGVARSRAVADRGHAQPADLPGHPAGIAGGGEAAGEHRDRQSRSRAGARPVSRPASVVAG